MAARQYRRPVSVIVIVHTPEREVLLLRRSRPFDFWQSVTGSLDAGETHAQAAARELHEETGLTNEGTLEYAGVSRQFAIDSRWRDRFEPGVVENVEFEWRYRVAEKVDIALDTAEHSEYCWLPAEDAVEQVWSWTNKDALIQLLT